MSIEKSVREVKEELKFSDLLPAERKLVEEMVSRAPTMKLIVRGEGHGSDYQEYTSECVIGVSDYLAHYQSALNRIQAQREIFGIDDIETVAGKTQTLRYHTGASLSDVRKALEENSWDYWFAYKQLREKGLGGY